MGCIVHLHAHQSHSRQTCPRLLDQGISFEAFRRFADRKGLPLTFYSDNATPFKSADRQLKEFLKFRAEQDIRNHSFDNLGTIEWRYSTEVAPWTNGCTERLVGLFKKQLMIALQKTWDSLYGNCLCDQWTSTRASNWRRNGENYHSKHVGDGPILETVPDSQHHTYDLRWQDREHRNITMLQFWKKWQFDYLLTMSVDNKWAKGTNPVLKNPVMW